jgi:lysozyme
MDIEGIGGTMKINGAALDLIKSFEGWRSKAYRDAVGVWTIGYGHTSMAGEPQVRRGMVISEAEGEAILRRDVEKFAIGVAKAITRKVNDNQFGALVSFAYNVGLGGFRKSSVLTAVNSGQFDRVPHRLMLWNKAGGKVLPGLTRRRKAEGDLFMSPVAAAKPAKMQDFDVPHPPRDEIPPAEAATDENPGKLEGKPGGGAAAGGAGAVIVGGGVAVAAGYDWKLIGLVAGCLLLFGIIAFFVWKLRSDK